MQTMTDLEVGLIWRSVHGTGVLTKKARIELIDKLVSERAHKYFDVQMGATDWPAAIRYALRDFGINPDSYDHVTKKPGHTNVVAGAK
jgi:hypothetical protein